MNVDIENFIEGQYRKYFTSNREPNKEHINLYKTFPNEKMQLLFSTMHADALHLFDRMNSRLPTEDSTNYYWAEDSRGLLKIIDIYSVLAHELRNTELSFHVDEYYDGIFKNCQGWLAEYNGSIIPAHMDKVVLYYLKPLFILDGNVPLAELHALGERVEFLGRGGFGEVYKYHHPYIDIDFAVKVFDPVFVSDAERVEGEKRFFREARILFRLNHRNIVRVYDVGRIDGRPFIKMEYVQGETLDKVQQRYSNLPFSHAGRATIQILSGLQHAHDCGIVHRDLKPANIMVETDGWICKIIDFGISAFLNGGYTKLTRTGERIAGGPFIDPLLDSKPDMRDPRSDIFSAGAVFYYLLCGHPPGVDAESYLRQSNNGIRDEEVAVVMKAISTDIENRYNSCEEMIYEIKRLLP